MKLMERSERRHGDEVWVGLRFELRGDERLPS
jgi:hypothetical protein